MSGILEINKLKKCLWCILEGSCGKIKVFRNNLWKIKVNFFVCIKIKIKFKDKEELIMRTNSKTKKRKRRKRVTNLFRMACKVIYPKMVTKNKKTKNSKKNKMNKNQFSKKKKSRKTILLLSHSKMKTFPHLLNSRSLNNNKNQILKRKILFSKSILQEISLWKDHKLKEISAKSMKTIFNKVIQLSIVNTSTMDRAFLRSLLMILTTLKAQRNYKMEACLIVHISVLQTK